MEEKKLGITPLVALVVGSIIGGGIFNLMSDMAVEASVGPVIIGWVIAGVGMGFLAFCFQNLSAKRPDLDAGIYSYASERPHGKYSQRRAWRFSRKTGHGHRR